MRLLWVLVLNGLFVSSAVADDLLVVPVGELFVDQPVAFEVSGAAAGERLELKVKRANGKMKAFGQMTADESGEAVFHGVLPKGPLPAANPGTFQCFAIILAQGRGRRRFIQQIPYVRSVRYVRYVRLSLIN